MPRLPPDVLGPPVGLPKAGAIGRHTALSVVGTRTGQASRARPWPPHSQSYYTPLARHHVRYYLPDGVI